MPLPALLSDTSGAVTVDWTVLAASVVGLGLASVGAVRSGTNALGSDVQGSLTSASVASLSRVESPAPDMSQTGLIAQIGGTRFDTYAGYTLPGWSYTGGTPQFLLSGHLGMVSASGGPMLDFNHGGNLSLSSSVQVGTGESVFLTLNAGDYNQGSNGNAVEVWFGGERVGVVAPNTRTATPYRFELRGGAGNGTNTLELRGTQSSYSAYGVWVDGITVR